VVVETVNELSEMAAAPQPHGRCLTVALYSARKIWTA